MVLLLLLIILLYLEIYHIKGLVTYDFFQLYLPAPQRYNARP